MRSIEDKGCVINNATTQETSSCVNLEFEKSSRTSHHRHPHPHPHNNRTAGLGKPTPSKWDDAQKWLVVNLSRGGEKSRHQSSKAAASPRNSNADDRRLIAPAVPKRDYDSSGEEDKEEEREKNIVVNINSSNKPTVIRSPILCLRDIGTEMTPIVSQEPSRAPTPVRATSPVSSGSSTPVKSVGQKVVNPSEKECEGVVNATENKTDDGSGNMNSKEIRAMAWEEAERAKYTARFKREEVKIHAWGNHRERKAEMEYRQVEAKAERLKSRAQENYNIKLASTRRIAEEKRATAEAKLQAKAMKTCERADYIRRNGHLPSYFSFKLPSFCW